MLMFLGRLDQARSAYLQYRGSQNVANGKSWDELITDDFARMRKEGKHYPLMSDVEARLSASR